MQSFLKTNKENILLLLIIIFGAFLRLNNLNWDQGHYLHPDERLYVNSSSISLPKSLPEFFSSESPLNPKMFYYGSFPLFLYKIINLTILSSLPFTIASRAISSFFSILTIPLIFFLSKQFFSKKISLIATFVFTFSIGLIQHAHFNTTESILIFLLTFITLLSIYIVRQKPFISAFILGILVGMAYATKIVGLTFAFIPIASFTILIFKKRGMLKIISLILIFATSAIVAGFLFAPYQIIDYQQFFREQTYMQNVINGKDKPPFTIIYEGTIPYIYQLTQIFPFIFGFLSLPFAFVGLYFIIKKYFKEKIFYSLYIFILLYPIGYFLWSGIWYAKFSRYYILLLPFLSIWSAYALAKLRKPILIIILLGIAINGILFLRIYQGENTRIRASEWMYDNLADGSILLGEHWDDNLPLPLPNGEQKRFIQIQLSVYNLPDNQEKIFQLTQNLSKGDYFIISSRRVYYSILRNPTNFPLTSRFYYLLFEGKLGYKLQNKFVTYPFLFSDDFADESFQSYDHPPVYVFKNGARFSQQKIYNLLKKK